MAKRKSSKTHKKRRSSKKVGRPKGKCSKGYVRSRTNGRCIKKCSKAKHQRRHLSTNRCRTHCLAIGKIRSKATGRCISHRIPAHIKRMNTMDLVRSIAG